LRKVDDLFGGGPFASVAEQATDLPFVMPPVAAINDGKLSGLWSGEVDFPQTGSFL
jgi:hypothetical protein